MTPVAIDPGWDAYSRPVAPLNPSPEFIAAVEAITPELWDLHVVYAKDARGYRVPSFAVVGLPMKKHRPAREVVVCRLPGELGHAWHHRAKCEAVVMAEGHGCVTGQVWVLFMDTLPPKAWREEKQLRNVLRWQMQNTELDGLQRVWAAQKLQEITAPHLTRSGA